MTASKPKASPLRCSGLFGGTGFVGSYAVIYNIGIPRESLLAYCTLDTLATGMI